MWIWGRQWRLRTFVVGALGRHVVGVVGAHLQEALEASGRVLGPHALHAVRLQQHDTGLPHPLGLPARDELVDDALRHVVEVAELRLPQHQRVRVRHRVAHLEAQHTCIIITRKSDPSFNYVSSFLIKNLYCFIRKLNLCFAYHNKNY